MSKKVRVLIAEDEETLAEVIAFILESKCNAQVKCVTTGKDAIAALQTETFDLLLCDYNMPQGNGGKVFEFIQTLESKPKYIMLSSDHPKDHDIFSKGEVAGYLEKPFHVEALIGLMKNLFSFTPQKTVATMLDDIGLEDSGFYCRIRPALLHSLNILPCDLFIKISDEKYVKMMNENDVFGNSDLDRFKAKNVAFLFVKKSNVYPIIAKLIQRMKSQVQAELAKQSPDGPLALSEAMQATIHDIASELGFSQHLVEAVKINMDVALSVMKKNKNLFSLIKTVMFDSESYVSSHSVLLPYISCGLAEIMDWHSEQTFEKLTMASLLHDCTLRNSDLARVETDAELKEKNFSQKEIQQWHDHMEYAAEIAKNFSEIPPDVDQIIIQHHELPDGTGLPNHINHSRIAPLSAIFIIAQDVLRFVEKHGQLSSAKFVEKYQTKYAHGQFKRILIEISKSKKMDSAA